MDRDVGIFPDADLERVLLQTRERGGWIWIALRVPAKVEPRLHVPCRAAIEREHIAGDAVRAQLFGDAERFLGGPVIRARHPQPEAPQRHVGRTAGERGVALDDLGRLAAGEEKEIERFVVDDDRIRAVRPFGTSDPVRHIGRRVDEHAPGARLASAAARTPAERRGFVGEPAVHAERIFDARLHELTALVQRAELLAESVDRLPGGAREASDPLLPAARAADYGQARETAEMFVGDRGEQQLVLVKEAQLERLSRQLEARAARAEHPYPGLGLRDLAALRAAEYEPVIWPGVRSD